MTTLSRRFPVPEFSSLRREMDRLFTDFQSNQGDNTDTLVWMPRADLAETTDAFVLALDLPGMNPENVDVTLEEDTLTISGHRASSADQVEGRFHRIERSYGRFLRTVRFSSPVDGDRIEASFDNGVLNVVIPKAETSKPRRIEVTNGTHRELASGDGASADAVDVEINESAS